MVLRPKNEARVARGGGGSLELEPPFTSAVRSVLSRWGTTASGAASGSLIDAFGVTFAPADDAPVPPRPMRAGGRPEATHFWANDKVWKESQGATQSSKRRPDV